MCTDVYMFTHSPINLAVDNPAEMKGLPPPRQRVEHPAWITFNDVNISHPSPPAEQQRLPGPHGFETKRRLDSLRLGKGLSPNEPTAFFHLTFFIENFFLM